MAVSVDIEKKLHGFTLKVKLESDGSPMGILGASGAEKSMTLRCIAGIQTPDSGRIVVNDKVLLIQKRKSILNRRRGRSAIIFQNYAPFSYHDCREEYRMTDTEGIRNILRQKWQIT